MVWFPSHFIARWTCASKPPDQYLSIGRLLAVRYVLISLIIIRFIYHIYIYVYICILVLGNDCFPIRDRVLYLNWLIIDAQVSTFKTYYSCGSTEHFTQSSPCAHVIMLTNCYIKTDMIWFTYDKWIQVYTKIKQNNCFRWLYCEPLHQWPLLLTWFNFNPSMDK